MSPFEDHDHLLELLCTNDTALQLSEREVLEAILSYTVKNHKVEAIAQQLIDRFGRLSLILDAPLTELTSIPGVGRDCAIMLKLIPPLSRRYLICKNDTNAQIFDSESAGNYMLPYFCGALRETLYLLCLNKRGHVLCCRNMMTGNLNSTTLNIRDIVGTALAINADAVVIAHNHPSGLAIPSPEDINTTIVISHALDMVGIRLLDHLIVADNDIVSLSDSGFFDSQYQQERLINNLRPNPKQKNTTKAV